MVLQETSCVFNARTERRNALGYIFEGIDPELYERLNPEVASDTESTTNTDIVLETESEKEVQRTTEKSDEVNALDKIIGQAPKIRRSFSLNCAMVDDISVMKYFQRRNGMANLLQDISVPEKNFLRDVYSHTVTSSCELLGY